VADALSRMYVLLSTLDARFLKTLKRIVQ
jgi:hypothetical protein